MRIKAFAMTAMGLCTLAVPASAQIIATSIPRAEAAGTGKGVEAGEKKWALHIMGSPFAKWKVNSYRETTLSNDTPDFQQAATTDSSSKFIGAVELAFKAGSDFNVGVGGWYNELGTADVVFFEVEPLAFVQQTGLLALAGTAKSKIHVFELHGNVFWNDVGVQVGVVKTKSQYTSLLRGAQRVTVDLNTGFINSPETLQVDLPLTSPAFSTTSWDAFLVYKRGSESGAKYPWAFSTGGGFYRDNESKGTSFSGFLTGSVQFYKGLGVDASFWYVGAKDQTAGQQALGNLLGDAIETNLSRFTIGIGYSFPN
jgi:hypothetical protein